MSNLSKGVRYLYCQLDSVDNEGRGRDLHMMGIAKFKNGKGKVLGFLDACTQESYKISYSDDTKYLVEKEWEDIKAEVEENPESELSKLLEKDFWFTP